MPKSRPTSPAVASAPAAATGASVKKANTVTKKEEPKVFEETTIEISAVKAILEERRLPAPIFAIGVLSLLLKSYLLGHFPPHLACYSLLQWPVLFYVVFNDFKRKNQTAYFVELCWTVNFLGWAVLLYEVLTSLGHVQPFGSDELRNRVGYAFFVVVNGPLAAAVIMNSNALVLHDVAKTSGVFIHLNPALVAYALRWRPIWTGSASWSPFNSHGSIFATETAARALPKSLFDAVALYLVWWVPYGCWLFVRGSHFAKSTTQRSSFRDLYDTLKGTTVNEKIRSYLIGHFLCSTLTLLVARYCYTSFLLHTFWIVSLLVYATWLGSRYYEFTYGGVRVQRRLVAEATRRKSMKAEGKEE